MNEIQMIANRFGLSLDDLRNLLNATDAARGVCTAADVQAGLSRTVALYLQTFASAAERIENPDDRHVVEHFLSQATELLIEQLAAAPHVPN